MKLKYIKGVKVKFGTKEELVSYFNIVPTDIPSNADQSDNSFLKNWVETKDVFNFFLQRRQWVDGNIE